VNRAFTCLVVATALLAGCRNVPQSKEAIRKGVIDYLSKRSDMMVSSMDIEIVSVSFRKDEADAVVSFRPKGVSEGGMQMSYTLENKGGQWAVKGKRDSGSAPHGQGGAVMPPAQSGGALPSGHPPIGGKAEPPGKPK
jgi:hypothetical protein